MVWLRELGNQGYQRTVSLSCPQAEVFLGQDALDLLGVTLQKDPCPSPVSPNGKVSEQPRGGWGTYDCSGCRQAGLSKWWRFAGET